MNESGISKTEDLKDWFLQNTRKSSGSELMLHENKFKTLTNLI